MRDAAGRVGPWKPDGIPADLRAQRRGLGDSDTLPHLHPSSEDQSITRAWPPLKERKRKRLDAYLTMDLIYCS